MKRTKREYEKMLNEMGCPDHDHPDCGGRVSHRMVNKYGTWLRLHDPISFTVGFAEFCQNPEPKKDPEPMEVIAGLITGDWKEGLRTLPEKELKFLNKVISVNKQLERLKFRLISLPEFQKELKKIMEA